MSGRTYAAGARFETAVELREAARKVREMRFTRWDVHSPFPIDGMDQAMGLERSSLGYFVFFGGLLGALTALSLEWIPSAILYPLIVDGKPFGFASSPAFFPIIFELTILFAAFAAVIGMLLLNGLPRWHHSVFNWDEFGRFSDDGFFLVIEAADPKFTEKGTRELLESLGGRDVTLISE